MKVTGTYKIEGRPDAGPEPVSIDVPPDENFEAIRPGIFVNQGKNLWQVLAVDRQGYKPTGLVLRHVRGAYNPKKGKLTIKT